jgi:hypothetical protein
MESVQPVFFRLAWTAVMIGFAFFCSILFATLLAPRVAAPGPTRELVRKLIALLTFLALFALLYITRTGAFSAA